jgi:hypothetical protein
LRQNPKIAAKPYKTSLLTHAVRETTNPYETLLTDARGCHDTRTRFAESVFTPPIPPGVFSVDRAPAVALGGAVASVAGRKNEKTHGIAAGR